MVDMSLILIVLGVLVLIWGAVGWYNAIEYRRKYREELNTCMKCRRDPVVKSCDGTKKYCDRHVPPDAVPWPGHLPTSEEERRFQKGL